MKKILTIIILCSAVGFLVSALAADIREFTFDNGLKLLVKEDHRAPVVVSQVWYKVGSSYEHGGITGISHALEHMMFKGTKKHAGGEFSRIIAENGGEENAFTSTDYTAYFQTLEKSRLPISFELESDRMRNLTLPADEFSKEIEVVKEERRMRTEDDPQSLLYETLHATAFETSPYRQPIIGWMADLEEMKIESLRDWYRQWYAPNNAIVIVVGDVHADEVYALAQKYFAPLPREDISIVAASPETEQRGLKRVTVKRPAELPYLLLGYKTPSLMTSVQQPEAVPDWEPYALEVLGGILDGGDSARFNGNLVRGREIAASVGLDYSLTSRLGDLLVIDGVPAGKHTMQELEQALRDEIEKVKNEPVSAEELARVKAQVIAADIYQRDSLFFQAMIMGIFETVGLSWHRIDEYVERVKTVTAEQVQQVAKKYLIDDSLTVGVLEPLPLDGATVRPPSGVSEHVR